MVAVSSCGDDKDKKKGDGGQQGKLNVEEVFKDVDSLKEAVGDVLNVVADDA